MFYFACVWGTCDIVTGSLIDLCPRIGIYRLDPVKIDKISDRVTDPAGPLNTGLPVRRGFNW